MSTESALQPSVGVCTLLGSLFVHVDEWLSEDAHEFDESAIRGLLAHPLLLEWIEEM